MKQRGQTTIFVVLGIVIIALVAAGIYFRGVSEKTAAEKEADIAKALPEDIANIRKSVSECAQFTLEDAVAHTGLFGGFTEPKEGALFTGNDFVNYGYAERKKMLPSVLEMQEKIAEYINEFVPDCIFIENEKFDITFPEPKASVSILDKKVAAEVEYKAVIKSGEDTFTLSEPFAAETAVRLKQMHEAASKIVGKAAEKPESISVDYLLTLGEEIDVMPIDEQNVVYRILGKDAVLRSELGNMEFTFIFATKAQSGG